MKVDSTSLYGFLRTEWKKVLLVFIITAVIVNWNIDNHFEYVAQCKVANYTLPGCECFYPNMTVMC